MELLASICDYKSIHWDFQEEIWGSTANLERQNTRLKLIKIHQIYRCHCLLQVIKDTAPGILLRGRKRRTAKKNYHLHSNRLICNRQQTFHIRKLNIQVIEWRFLLTAIATLEDRLVAARYTAAASKQAMRQASISKRYQKYKLERTEDSLIQ